MNVQDQSPRKEPLKRRLMRVKVLPREEGAEEEEEPNLRWKKISLKMYLSREEEEELGKLSENIF